MLSLNSMNVTIIYYKFALEKREWLNQEILRKKARKNRLKLLKKSVRLKKKRKNN
jgi:hypothetical protein